MRAPIIDTHTHFVPPRAAALAETGGTWHGIRFGLSARGKITSSVGALSMEIPWPMPLESFRQRLRSMDERKVDVHVLSIGPTLYYYNLDPDNAASFARAANDDLAEIVSTAPDRFAGLGYLSLQDPAGSVDELERCMRDLGFCGVMVGTNVNGLDWDEPALFPVLQAAEQLGALVYFHPVRSRADPFLKKYHLRNLIGMPFDTTITLASLIFGGIFDRLPGLKACFSHAGGFGVLGIGRMDHGYEVRAEASGIARLPSDYLTSCWFDTITHNERALRYVIDTVGADRVVLGSDYPADMGEPYPTRFVESCASLTAAEKAMILSRNAVEMLGLKMKAPAA